jgi:hypothetical protein
MTKKKGGVEREREGESQRFSYSENVARLLDSGRDGALLKIGALDALNRGVALFAVHFGVGAGEEEAEDETEEDGGGSHGRVRREGHRVLSGGVRGVSVRLREWRGSWWKRRGKKREERRRTFGP